MEALFSEISARVVSLKTKAAFTFKEGQGGGCSKAAVNKDFIGKDASVLADAAGINVPAGTQLLFAETDASHAFVDEEQMMPFLPIVRVRDVDDGIQECLKAEHGYKHTSIIHSHNVNHMTAMARAIHRRCCWPPERLVPDFCRRSRTSSISPARSRLLCTISSSSALVDARP